MRVASPLLLLLHLGIVRIIFMIIIIAITAILIGVSMARPPIQRHRETELPRLQTDRQEPFVTVSRGEVLVVGLLNVSFRGPFSCGILIGRVRVNNTILITIIVTLKEITVLIKTIVLLRRVSVTVCVVSDLVFVPPSSNATSTILWLFVLVEMKMIFVLSRKEITSWQLKQKNFCRWMAILDLEEIQKFVFPTL